MRFPRILAAVVLVASGCATAPPGQPGSGETRPTLLASLDGNWMMVGDVLGKRVMYRLTVQPVLGRAFTELHMRDVQKPPQYEARVFVGYDKKSDQVIVHWLDVFGANGSIPHGTGGITDNTVEFTIPYQQGPFRDTLRFDPTTGKWRFTIEAPDGSGGWKHFAAYDIERYK
jgi:hypothetical protein